MNNREWQEMLKYVLPLATVLVAVVIAFERVRSELQSVTNSFHAFREATSQTLRQHQDQLDRLHMKATRTEGEFSKIDQILLRDSNDIASLRRNQEAVAASLSQLSADTQTIRAVVERMEKTSR